MEQVFDDDDDDAQVHNSYYKTIKHKSCTHISMQLEQNFLIPHDLWLNKVELK